MLKLYNIKRDGLFELIAKYPEIQLSSAGSIWVTGYIPEEIAQKILDNDKEAISLFKF